MAEVTFEIRGTAVLVGPPLTVVQTEVKLQGSFVDFTIYVNHGSSFFTPQQISATAAVTSLPAGAYTARLYTMDRTTPATEFQGPTFYGTLDFLVVEDSVLGSAVEYFNPSRSHYFQTADKTEIAALDGGIFPGWARTGQSYPVYVSSAGTQLPPVLVPVCRYYGLPDAGLDTHFFSAFVSECAAVHAKWPTQWLLETPSAYWVALPSTTDGTCLFGTSPLYRIFNNRPDVNHRYTTSIAIRQQMIASGWVPEGFGDLGVAMCVNSSN
ncbi:MAG: hypothetical protein ABI886_09550 [Betaproteobacteria bacterium]